MWLGLSEACQCHLPSASKARWICSRHIVFNLMPFGVCGLRPVDLLTVTVDSTADKTRRDRRPSFVFLLRAVHRSQQNIAPLSLSAFQENRI